MPEPAAPPRTDRPSLGARALDLIERVGNRLPDPALLFLWALAIVWLLSALLDGHAFSVPSRDGPVARVVESQLTGAAMVRFLSDLVATFTGFPPLGVVLVSMMGIGVAEHSGFIGAVLKRLIAVTPRALLTPMLILVAQLSHLAADAGMVLVVPLGGVIFYAAGRHPVAGIAAAFAGVSGGFSATPVPTSLDPLLAGLTESAARLLDPAAVVNPLVNWLFNGVACVLIIAVGWYLTDRVIEPRLARVAVDGDPADMPTMEPLTEAERRGMRAGLIAGAIGVVLLVVATLPAGSPLRAPGGGVTAADAPLMRAIVPIIFLLCLVPGLVHGKVAGTLKDHRDVVRAVARTMNTMGYYLVMALCAALFIYSFNKSQLGALLAVEGADALRAAGLPTPFTLIGIVLLCAAVNLLIGSASAKWALLSVILVPMLMQLGLSPALAQGAFRIGDSSTNVVTPLMPYFPLIVTFVQRYVKRAGIGTLTATMLPYSLAFLAVWTGLLMVFWALGLPLGIGGQLTYP